VTKLGPWVEKMGDWRRYWETPSVTGVDEDLAAIAGTSKEGPGWRAFSPEGERKWAKEGLCPSIEEARAQADAALRSKYGV
jgi:hypothetical protein